jgi:hypothetical protein
MLLHSSGLEYVSFSISYCGNMVTQIHEGGGRAGNRNRSGSIDKVDRKTTLKMVVACVSVSYLFITALGSSCYVAPND